MNLLRIFRGPLRRQAQPSWGAVMLRQNFLTQTSKQRSLPSGRAAIQIAILMFICGGSLAGCGTSSDQVGGDGGSGLYAFHTKLDTFRSNPPGFEPTNVTSTEPSAA